MPQLEDAQSIIDTEDESSPEENFSSAFDDLEEVEDKVEDESEETEEVDDEESEDSEDEESEDKEVDEPEEEDEEEEKEELSALELAEQQARDKFLKKDKSEDADKEKEDEPKEETPQAEIDFTDVDTDPVKFVESLVAKVTDEKKQARLKETLGAYPEIGELAALVSRELVSRQTVKVVDDPTNKMPEDLSAKLEDLDNIREELAERRYFDAIEAKVPGARSIVSTEKFTDWLGKQSVGINTLASSGYADDAVAVLKAYQEHSARASAKTIDDKAGKRKKKADSSMKKSRSSAPSRSEDTSKDDFAAGFGGA